MAASRAPAIVPRTLASSATRRADVRDRWVRAFLVSTWLHVAGSLTLVVGHALVAGSGAPGEVARGGVVELQRRPDAPIGADGALGGSGAEATAGTANGAHSVTTTPPTASSAVAGDAVASTTASAPSSLATAQTASPSAAESPSTATVSSTYAGASVADGAVLEVADAITSVGTRDGSTEGPANFDAIASDVIASDAVAAASHSATARQVSMDAPATSATSSPPASIDPSQPSIDPSETASVAAAADLPAAATSPTGGGASGAAEETSGDENLSDRAGTALAAPTDLTTLGSRGADIRASNVVAGPPSLPGTEAPAVGHSTGAPLEAAGVATAGNRTEKSPWDRAARAPAAKGARNPGQGQPILADWTPFVRTHEADGDADADATYVAAHDRAADTAVRTQVGTVILGSQDAAAVSGRPQAPVAPARLRIEPQMPRVPRIDPGAGERERTVAAPLAGGGGAVATGGTGEGGTQFDDEIDGDQLLRGGTPDWDAAAVRIVVKPKIAAAAETTPRTITRTPAKKPAPKPIEDPVDEPAATEAVALPEAPVILETEDAGTPDPTPLTDFVDEFRLAMNWAPIDREELKAHSGGGAAGDAAGSEQAVLDVPLAPKLEIDAIGVPEGQYTERIYAIVQARWLAQDLDLEARAVGIQGDVTVVFRVDSSGRVNYIAVTRSSGNEKLDDMARNSIPEKFPRFPRAMNMAAIVQEIHFVYDNPLILVDK